MGMRSVPVTDVDAFAVVKMSEMKKFYGAVSQEVPM